MLFLSSSVGEKTLPGAELPKGWARGERHSADQRGADPHGVPARDAVQRAQLLGGSRQVRGHDHTSTVTDHATNSTSQIIPSRAGRFFELFYTCISNQPFKLFTWQPYGKYLSDLWSTYSMKASSESQRILHNSRALKPTSVIGPDCVT